MTKKFLAGLAIGFLMIHMGGIASATKIIDQNQWQIGAYYMANFYQTDLAQSFKQTSDNIVGAGIFLTPYLSDYNFTAATDTITIQLTDALVDGNILASGSNLGTLGQWVDVFWNKVSISADTTYYLIFSSASNNSGIAGTTYNSYPHGQLYAGTEFYSIPDFDYTFRTYADDGSNPVPEPTTMLLFGLGLLGLAGVNRRKK